MSEIDLVVVDDPAAVVADMLASAARDGGHVVLTGGSTPAISYELAAQREPDWSRTELWWGDERCVRPDDERSNYGMAKRTLLDNIAVQPAARPAPRTTTASSATSRGSTSCCSASGRTATSRRSIPISRRSTRASGACSERRRISGRTSTGSR